MTTAAALIQDGFREGNLIPIGTEPTDDEKAEALRALNRLVEGFIGYCIGENLVDWPVPFVQRTGSVAANPPLLPGSVGDAICHNNAYPAANTRIVWDGTDQTIYFPEAPDDGARMAIVKAGSGTGTLTIDGNGRLIEGGASYSSSTADRRHWIYRADLADWKHLTELAETDEFPFPSKFDDFWICSLSMRLSSRYGKKPGADTVETYRRMKSAITAHYSQSAPGTSGGVQLKPSAQSYDAENWWF